MKGFAILPVMRIYLKIIFPVFLFMFAVTAVPEVQPGAAGRGGAGLQKQYAAAVYFQKHGELDQAAAQYRAFLTGVLSELAVGHAQLGNYAKAASDFDDALALEPNAAAIRLSYATAALELGDPEHAATLAQAYLSNPPGDSKGQAAAHQILGRALLKMSRFDDARKQFESAVALDPNFANGYDLAVACLDLVDGKCAEQIFGEMEKSYGDTSALHMQFGRAYGDSDLQQQAVVEFRKVIAEDPRFPQAHYNLAAAMLAVEDDTAGTLAAEKELQEELQVSPRNALAYAALGKLAVSQHEDAEAEKYLKRATELDPNSPDAFLYLGQMYYDTHRAAESEAALRQAIRLTTDVSQNRYQIQRAHFLLGRLLMQQHKETEAHAEMEIAHTLLNKTLARDKSKLAGLLDTQNAAEPSATPTQPAAQGMNHAGKEAAQQLAAFEQQAAKTIADSYNNLGAIAATHQDYAQAMIDFRHAEGWNPLLEGVDYNWGRAAFSASQFGDAIPPLARSLLAHPDDAGIRIALGISQYRTRDYKGCVQTLQSMDGKPDAIPQVRYVYADSLVKTGQIAAGVERLEALDKEYPEIPDVHGALGEAFESQGNAVQAIAELEAAARMQPGNPEFHLDLAHAYKMAGRSADADKQIGIYNQLHTAQPASQAK